MTRLLVTVILLGTIFLPTTCPAGMDNVLIQRAVEKFLRTQTSGVNGNITINVPTIENKLAPCNAVEPFLPAGSRAWGRVMVGIRCTHGANWSFYLRAEVKVEGQYLTSARPLKPGQLIQFEDLALERGDLTQFPPGILSSPEQALGQQAKLTLSAGQPLRGDMLRPPPAIQRGQNITLISRGEGFHVSTEAVAMNDAAAGQVVQVRTSAGLIRTGIAQSGGIVEISN